MKLYDRRCKACGRVERDVDAASAADLVAPCGCGGTMVWAPGLGSVDAREPFYDHAFDRQFSSYRELERHADRAGKVVMTASECDSVRRPPKDGSRLNEAIQKSYYRLRHGYRDHPALDKE